MQCECCSCVTTAWLIWRQYPHLAPSNRYKTILRRTHLLVLPLAKWRCLLFRHELHFILIRMGYSHTVWGHETDGANCGYYCQFGQWLNEWMNAMYLVGRPNYFVSKMGVRMGAMNMILCCHHCFRRTAVQHVDTWLHWKQCPAGVSSL